MPGRIVKRSRSSWTIVVDLGRDPATRTIGLRWQDVDLETATISIQQTAQRIGGRGIVFRQPKTHLSRRAVALSPDGIELLRRHRREQSEARMLAGPA